jgi:hypothetical protein
VEFERNSVPGEFNYGTAKSKMLEVLAKKKIVQSKRETDWDYNNAHFFKWVISFTGGKEFLNIVLECESNYVFLILVFCVEYTITTSKKDANQTVFFMLAQALYQKGVVEHYSYYLEQAEIKRIRNPRIPGRAPSVAASATLEDD